MVATPERIGFISQPYRKALTDVDATVEAAYGDLARETTADEPIETLFDDMDDVEAIAVERLALLSPERARFQATLPEGLNFALSLDYAQTTPAGVVADPERNILKAALTTGLSFDWRRGAAAIEMWG